MIRSSIHLLCGSQIWVSSFKPPSTISRTYHFITYVNHQILLIHYFPYSSPPPFLCFHCQRLNPNHHQSYPFYLPPSPAPQLASSLFLFQNVSLFRCLIFSHVVDIPQKQCCALRVEVRKVNMSYCY